MNNLKSTDVSMSFIIIIFTAERACCYRLVYHKQALWLSDTDADVIVQLLDKIRLHTNILPSSLYVTI
jgi:hypothetical protein